MSDRRLILNIEIDRKLLDSLARRADEDGRPVANLLRHIAARAVAQREQQAQPKRKGA